MNYDIIEQTSWKTSLFHFDCESCFLSNIVPCHVYSKIMSTTSLEYTTRIILYIVLYSSIYELMYIQNNINHNICPSIQVDNCILSDNCLDNYMIVDSIPSACRYVDGICVYNEYQCIYITRYNDIYQITFLLSSIMYIAITYLHYQARKHIQNKKNISSSMSLDICAVTLCSSCGLSQEYREL